MAPPTTVRDIPDNLLHHIFRLLGTHDAVVRAAAVCKRWRRIASTRGRDMCWYRHDFSTCIGHYHALDPSFISPAGTKKKPAAAAHRGGQQLVAFVPASPSIEPRHFSLDFLPGGRPWELVDGLGTLLLLANHRRGFFPDLIVCEPISRQFITIQPIPGMKYSRCLGAFLGYRYNTIAMSSFTVSCVLYDGAEGMEAGVSAVTARVYSHRAPPNPPDRRWKNGWDVSSHTACSCIYLRGAESARYAGSDGGRGGGTKFWATEDDDGTSVLAHSSNSSTKFKHFRLGDHVRGWHSHNGGSTFRFCTGVKLVSIVGDELRVFMNREFYYYRHEGVGEWVHERSLRLPEAAQGLPGYKESYFRRTAKIVTASEGYVVLTPAEETWVFSVDLETMEVEREHARNWFPGEVYPYEMWTRPKVHACVVQCKRRRGGICREFCKCSS